MAYSVLSTELTSKISKLVKKNNGIYFTPPSCVNKNIQLLLPFIAELKLPVINVLEPSCGSGEYITALHKECPQLNITGIEYNETIYNAILTLNDTNVTICNLDYLQYTTNIKYELIIGNPPYYVMKKSDVDSKYYPYFEGRPNIFILFIIKSLSLLTDNGILSFILPKNFLNCLYYDKTRKYIAEHFKILHIVDCDDKYIETQQDTIILILQPFQRLSQTIQPFQRLSQTMPEIETAISKEEFGSTFSKVDEIETAISKEEFGSTFSKVDEIESSISKEMFGSTFEKVDYMLDINNYTIFADKSSILQIKNLYNNSTSLCELGFKVSVGTVVWNQCKDILTDDDTKTRLIYSSDINNGKLIKKKYTNDEKKNYINKPGIVRPMIVINRGYGVGEYKFNYCLINCDTDYLIENHLICIECINSTDYDKATLIAKYEKIVESLNDDRTAEFINIYFGNNAINTTELNNILPIYLSK